MALQPKDPSQAVITSVGGAASGGTTTSTTPVIAGTADAGDIVSIYDGVRLLGTATVAANGTWSFTPTTPIKAGSHSFAAIAQDSQGNLGASSVPVNVQVATGVPATPVPPTFTDDSGHAIPAGGTTNDNHPHISGTGTAGDTITVYDGATVIGTTTVAGNGTWTFTPSPSLTDGNHSINVTEGNSTGASGHSTPVVITINTSVPAKPAVPTFTDDSGHTIPTGGTTADATPHMNGTGGAGDTITVYDGATVIGSTTVGPDGKWSFTPTTPLPSGNNSITVVDTNNAGTKSPASDPWTLTIVTSPPATPAAPALSDDLGVSIPAGSTTVDAMPNISGKGVANDTITIYDGSTVLGTAVVASNGTWSFLPKTDLSMGAHSINVTESNAAGVSAHSAATGLTIQASVVTTISITSVTDQHGGAIANGGSASGPLTVTGTVAGMVFGERVAIAFPGTAHDPATSNTSAYIYVTVGSNGTFSYTFSGSMTDSAGHVLFPQPGSINFMAIVVSGNTETAASATWTVNETNWSSSSIPGTPAAPILNDDHGYLIPPGSVTNDGHPHISGSGAVGDTITVYDGSTVLGTVQVDATGAWTFTPGSNLSTGSHSINVTEANSSGTSAHSTSSSFTFNGSIPSVPAPPTLSDYNGSVIPDGSLTNDASPTVGGTGTAGDTITIYDGGTVLGSTKIAANGTWTFLPSKSISAGMHSITVTESNGAGTSGHSNAAAVIVAAPTIMITSVVDQYGNLIQPGQSVSGPFTVFGTTSGLGTGDQVSLNLLGSASAPNSGYTRDQVWATPGNGVFSITVSNGLTDGTNHVIFPTTGSVNLQAFALDSGNSVFATSQTWTVNVTSWSATKVPPAPATPILIDSSGALIPAGGYAYMQTPKITGTGVVGDTITIYDGSTVIGSTTVATSGVWTFTSASLANGAHSFTVVEKNGYGSSAHSAAANFTFSATQTVLAITSVTDHNGTVIPVGGVASGPLTVTGTASGVPDGTQVSISVNGTANASIAGYTRLDLWTVVNHGTFSIILTQGMLNLGGQALFPQAGTIELFASIYTQTGNVTTPTYLVNEVSWTSLSATQNFGATATDDASASAQPDPNALSHHTTVGEHDAFIGHTANGNETVDLNADPASYFKESTAHIQGAGGSAVDTLHLTGDHQVLDLTSLTGHTAAAKISGIEVIDLGGHTNNLKLSLTDVLNLGEQDLFQKDGHQQLMVKGADGDTVDLSNAHIAGVADGQWQAEGTAVVGGVTYNVYEHSGAHTELLVQQGVQVALHN